MGVRTCQCQAFKYEDHLVPEDDLIIMDPSSPPAHISQDALYLGLVEVSKAAQRQADEAQGRIAKAELRADEAHARADRAEARADHAFARASEAEARSAAAWFYLFELSSRGASNAQPFQSSSSLIPSTTSSASISSDSSVAVVPSEGTPPPSQD